LFADEGVMDLATLKEHAARAHRLANHADLFTQRRLLDLAREYEAQIETIQQRTQKSQ
jgi:RNase P subunit RPR2